MKKILLLATVSILFINCGGALQFAPEDPINGAGAITIKFVQMNDVYEIAPTNGGKYGGLARVAHIRDSIKQQFPNTYLFLAGDFLSPSVIGSLTLDGEKINGRHMVDVLNAMEVDCVTFGNHEFDLSEEDLENRLNESFFTWTSANVKHVIERGLVPFAKQLKFSPLPISDFSTFTATDVDRNSIKFGVIGVTLPSNPKPYVAYGDIYKEAERAYKLAIIKSDFVVGLTHVAIDDDIKIASNLRDMPLIMGGHEHNNILEREGRTLITKADANAKSVYIHTLIYNLRTNNLNVSSELMMVTDKIASSARVERVVNRWTEISNGLIDGQPIPTEVVANREETPDEAAKKIIRNNEDKKVAKTEIIKTPKEITDISKKSKEKTEKARKAETKTSEVKDQVIAANNQQSTKTKIGEDNVANKITKNKELLIEAEKVKTNIEGNTPKIAEETTSKIVVNESTADKTEVKVESKPQTNVDVVLEKSKTETAKNKPANVVYTANVPLDGSDKANRSQQTNFGELMTKSMAFAYDDKVDGAIVNGGSVRLDDELAGDITNTDIFRALPFGGSVLKINIMGGLLREVLEYGESQKGSGAFLQRYNFSKSANGYWKNGEKVINDRKIYTIAISDYLLKGLDIPFLNADNKDIIEVYTPKEQENASDIRKTIITYLKSLPQ